MSKHNLPNKTTALALDQKVLDGVDKYFAKVKTLTVAGTVYTPKALKAVLQADIDAIRSLDSLKAQLAQQVVDADAARAKARDVRRNLKTHILGTYGASALTMLHDFGMNPPKPLGHQKVLVRAAGIMKAAVTRKAHRTMVEAVVPAPIAPAATNTPS